MHASKFFINFCKFYIQINLDLSQVNVGRYKSSGQFWYIGHSQFWIGLLQLNYLHGNTYFTDNVSKFGIHID